MTLGKEIGAGGEAQCFELSDQHICKIFNPERVDLSGKEEKLNYLVTLEDELNDETLAWPLGCVYDKGGKFIGYYMEKITNTLPLERIVYDVKDRKELIKNKKNLIKLCINLCKLFVKLHENYILVSDISFNNILFNPNNYKVYLIDIDSVQIDKFFCPLNTAEFVAPEYISDNLEKMRVTFREEQGELFLFAKALFEIIMCAQPYQYELGQFLKDYKNGNFNYPLKKKADGGDYSKLKTQIGYPPQAYIWDNLPDSLRAEFYNIFNGKDGKAFKPGRRTTAFQWYMKFDSYFKTLESLPNGDKRLEVNPNAFSDGSGANQVPSPQPNNQNTKKPVSNDNDTWYDALIQATNKTVRQAVSKISQPAKQPVTPQKPKKQEPPKPNKKVEKPDLNHSPKAIATLRNIACGLINDLYFYNDSDDLSSEKKGAINQAKKDCKNRILHTANTLVEIFKEYFVFRKNLLEKILKLKTKDLDKDYLNDYISDTADSIEDEGELLLGFLNNRIKTNHKAEESKKKINELGKRYKSFTDYYAKFYDACSFIIGHSDGE